MNRLILVIAALLALTTAPAGASEEKKPAEVGLYVDVAPVALPVVVDGRLINYVFVSVRLNIARMTDLQRLRDREPYFRDALVRAGHRTPFTRPDDYTSLDVAKMKAAILRDAAAIAGPGQIKSVIITSQAPKKRAGLPHPAG